MPDATPVAERVTRAANPNLQLSAREVQDRLTAATRVKDYEAILELYDSEAVVIAPDGTFKGHAEIERFLRSQLEPFSDLDIVIERRLAAGDSAADEGVLTATHTGQFRWPTGQTIAPTGRRISQRSADVATVRDGRVVSHRLYYDNADLAVQLGLGT